MREEENKEIITGNIEEGHHLLMPEEGREMILRGIHVEVRGGKKVLEAEVTEDVTLPSKVSREITEIPVQESYETKTIPIENIRNNPNFGLSGYEFTEKQISSIKRILKPMHFGLNEREIGMFKDIVDTQIEIWREGDNNNLRAGKKQLKRMIGEFHDGYPGRVRRIITYKERQKMKIAIPALLFAGIAAFGGIRNIPSPKPVNIENIVNEEYKTKFSNFVTQTEQEPAKVLLLGGSPKTDKNPTEDGDLEGHYKLSQRLLAGFLLDKGVSNEDIYFLEHNPAKVPLIKTRAYLDFIERNEGNGNLLRVMKKGVEDLIVDGETNYSNVTDILRNLSGEKAFIGFFNTDEGYFTVPGGNFSALKIKDLFYQVGGLENSIIMGVGKNGSSFIGPLELNNSLKISTQARTGSTDSESTRIIEDFVNSYFEDSTQSVLEIVNKVLTKDRRAYGSFIDSGGRGYIKDVIGGLVFENYFTQDGTPIKAIDQRMNVTKNGIIYSNEGSSRDPKIFFPENPETNQPYQLGFMYQNLGNFILGED